MTAQNQGVVNKYIYDAWGVMQSKLETVPNSITYTGRELDKSGLYYYRTRHYHSEVGRFLQRDPLLGQTGRNLGWNSYIYVENNPSSFIDPFGDRPILTGPRPDPGTGAPGEDSPPPRPQPPVNFLECKDIDGFKECVGVWLAGCLEICKKKCFVVCFWGALH